MNKHVLRTKLAPILNFGANPTRNLIMLLSGFGVTLLGLGLVLIAEYVFGGSVTQEIIAATGVVLIAVGLCVAGLGYLCLSVISLIRYILHEPSKESSSTTSSKEKTGDRSR